MEIVDYPNYLIYEDGRVWSKNRNRFLKGDTETSTGYYRTTLSKNNNAKHFLLHRLIAINYIPNPNNKECIDHIDGNKLNNKIENLRWVNHIENMNAYQRVRTTNRTGHKNILFRKDNNKWVFKKTIFGKTYHYRFETKNDALWFKFSLLILNSK